jgi:MFS family permease
MGLVENKSKNKGFYIILGYILLSAGCLSYVFVYNQFTLILTQIILGLGQAVVSPVFDSLYSDFVNKDQKAKEWAYWESILYIANAIAAIIGGYIAYTYGFKVLFVIMFIVSFIGVLTSIGMLGKKKELSRR